MGYDEDGRIQVLAMKLKTGKAAGVEHD